MLIPALSETAQLDVLVYPRVNVSCRLPLISVALVEGRALGGGAELTTACDFR